VVAGCLLVVSAGNAPSRAQAVPRATTHTGPTASGSAAGCRHRRFSDTLARSTLRVVVRRVSATARSHEVGAFPSITDQDGVWKTTPAKAWTSGFFPGSLWLAYQRTHRDSFRTWATDWTHALASRARVTSTHDVGFQLMTSFGNAYRLRHRAADRRTLLRGARSLATRYDAHAGAIRSWGARDDHRHFKVIVDGMMNLELLFWASAHGGSPTWRHRAVQHAETTRSHFVRHDGSVRHLVDFDPATGRVQGVADPQGYRPGSTWSRGQAWAIHGFATAYAATGRRDFLETARKTAAFYLREVPGDCVPYWDFDAPGIPDTPRDASAAAITADGLEQLSSVDPSRSQARRERAAAGSILHVLASRYVAPHGQATLDGSTSTFGVDPPDIGTAYGDYYFLHALLGWLPRP
jgi:unsaturated chondroitin disaccharide hydrolase